MNDESAIKFGVFAFLACIITGATLIGACDVPVVKAHRILDAAGYTDVKLQGHAWFACSEDDTLSTAFAATGPGGREVSGAVCCSIMVKDCTIRVE